MAKYDKQYLQHAKEDHFPREFGKPERINVYSSKQYLKLIHRFEGKNHCYLSVYRFRKWKNIGKHSFPVKNTAMIDKIFIDLDSTNPQEALEDVQKVFDFLEQGSQYKPLVYFSGMKGFAVYFYFPIIELYDPRYVIRKFVKGLEQNLTLKTVDWKIIGDVFRISRIPYTRHPKTADKPEEMCYCYPLIEEEIYGSMKAIIEQSYNPPIRDIKPDIFLIMGEKFKEIDIQPRVKRKKVKSVIKGKSFSIPTFTINKDRFGWIEELLTIPSHECRYPLTWQLFMPYLIRIKKYDFKIIKEKLSGWYKLGGNWEGHHVLDESWLRSQYHTQKRYGYSFMSKEHFEREFEVVDNMIIAKE